MQELHHKLQAALGEAASVKAGQGELQERCSKAQQSLEVRTAVQTVCQTLCTSVLTKHSDLALFKLSHHSSDNTEQLMR